MKDTPHPFPESSKLANPCASEFAVVVGFLDWLTHTREPKVWLAIGVHHNDTMPVGVSNEALIYEYLGVDAKALDAERTAILAHFVENQKHRGPSKVDPDE